METTLRELVEKWQAMSKLPSDAGDEARFGMELVRKCADELTALLDEAEKVDLVSEWRKSAADYNHDARASKGRHEGDYEFFKGHAQATAKCAYELAQWLAVNLELIKAEHYAAGFDAGTEAQARTEERKC